MVAAALQEIINFDRIGNRYWTFSTKGGRGIAHFFKFEPDGSISGYNHPNERHWQIIDGTLCLLSSQRVVTARFEKVTIENGLLSLSGPHVPKPEIVLLLKERDNEHLRPSRTRDALADEIRALGWSIGDHTYGVPTLIEKSWSKLVIGKYCSIASRVSIAFANHRTDVFTTYPFRTLRSSWQHVPMDVADHESRGDVVIGSDVWIGSDVFIGSGVSIGHGAVIGAKSVVVKDVPPYAIVGGNPARIIRYRFDERTIQKLLELAWWDLDDETVDALLPALMSSDIERLLAAAQKA